MPNASKPKTVSEYLDRMVEFSADPRVKRFAGLGVYLNHILDVGPGPSSLVITDMIDACHEHQMLITEPAGRSQNIIPKFVAQGVSRVKGLSVDNVGAIKFLPTGDAIRFDKETIISKDLTRCWNLCSHTSGVTAFNCMNDGRSDDIETYLRNRTNPEFARHGDFEGTPYYAPALGSHDIAYVYANPEDLPGWKDGLVPKELKDVVIMTHLTAGLSVTDPELDKQFAGDYSSNIGWCEDYFILLSRPVAGLHLKWWEAELDRIHKEYPEALDEMEGKPDFAGEVERMMYHHKSCHLSVRALRQMIEIMDGTDEAVGQIGKLLSSLAH